MFPLSPERESVSIAAEEDKEREMTEQVEVVIIGDGQAGLALLYGVGEDAAFIASAIAERG